MVFVQKENVVEETREVKHKDGAELCCGLWVCFSLSYILSVWFLVGLISCILSLN